MSDMATERVSVRLDSELRQQLEKEASLEGKSESEVLRRALEEYLSARGGRATCYELARKSGLVGAVKDGAADLSTNRKHFEGFGRR
jgi:metal-responsive CopG/Arc/MetJ family transcriptional regulator